MKPRVLLLETIHEDALGDLEAGAEVVPAWDEADPITLADGSIRAIMTRGKGLVTPQLLDACPELVCVARCGVGLDNIDCAAARERGVAVLNLPGCNAQTMAEHAVMLMLAVTRGLVESAVAVRAGDWATRTRFDRDEVGGRTAAIVGLGNIGSRVARLASALGMHVLYVDPTADSAEYERVDLDTALGQADVMSLHCQLDETTRGMINAERLAAMKPGAVLINTARGALVERAALIAAIESGHLAGYGADVLDVEPPVAGDPLLALPNVVVTPHVGSLTRSTYRQICVDSVRNVLAALGC